jgi:hypothetical protein
MMVTTGATYTLSLPPEIDADHAYAVLTGTIRKADAEWWPGRWLETVEGPRVRRETLESVQIVAAATPDTRTKAAAKKIAQQAALLTVGGTLATLGGIPVHAAEAAIAGHKPEPVRTPGEAFDPDTDTTSGSHRTRAERDLLKKIGEGGNPAAALRAALEAGGRKRTGALRILTKLKDEYGVADTESALEVLDRAWRLLSALRADLDAGGQAGRDALIALRVTQVIYAPKSGAADIDLAVAERALTQSVTGERDPSAGTIRVVPVESPPTWYLEGGTWPPAYRPPAPDAS